MRRLWRLLRGLAVVVALAVVGVWLSLTPADPALFPGPEGGRQVHVIDHGWHTGIMLRQTDLRAAAVAIGQSDPEAAARLRWLTSRRPDAEWLELGWGDAAFYQSTPTVGDVDVWLGLVALFWPTEAVLHVVPLWGPAPAAFPASGQVALTLSEDGYTALATRVAETIPQALPDPLGPSLYGHGAFYGAELDYHLFRTCNHWVSWLLRGAGVPSSAVPGTFSATLMVELEWRV